MKCCLRNPTKWVVVFSSHPVSPSVFGKLPPLYLSSEWYELHLFVKAPLFLHVKEVWDLTYFILFPISLSVSFCVCVCLPFFFLPLWNENEFAAGSSRYGRSRISGCTPFFTLLPSNDVWMWNCLPYVCLRPPTPTPPPLSLLHSFFFPFIAPESLWNSCTAGDWDRAIIWESCLVL